MSVARHSSRGFINFLRLRVQALSRLAAKSFHPRSLRFEISLLIMFLTGAVLAIICAALYWILAYTLYTNLDNSLNLKAQSVAQVIRSYLDVYGEDAQNLKSAIKKSVTEPDTSKKWWMFGFQRRWHGLIQEINLKEEYINFASYSGASLYRSKNMTKELTLVFNQHIPKEVTSEVSYRNVKFNQQKVRIINYPFSYDGQFDFMIQVGIFPRPIMILLENLLYSILGAIPVIMILSFFIGQFIVSRILGPIRKLTNTARRVSTDRLGFQIESQYYYKEMNSLIEAFNDMSRRLNKSFSHIEEFGSHVAHELKTPLTIIKGEAELALFKERKKEDYKKALQVNLEECSKMLKIIEDLLLLARMDYRPDIFDFKKVDLTALLNEIVGQTKVIAKDKKIEVKLDVENKHVYVEADDVHLKRLFLNILDNAIKFTPEKGSVKVSIRTDNDNVRVSIQDTGIGIKEEDIEKIFERFYRLNPQAAGSGLGLNIALTIARIHQGDIQIESTPGQGTTFIVTLPLSAS